MCGFPTFVAIGEEFGRDVSVAVLSESRFELCKVPVLSLVSLLLFVLGRELACSDSVSKGALFSMAGELLVSDALLFLLLTAALYNTDSDCHHVISSSKQRAESLRLRGAARWPCAQSASAVIGPVVSWTRTTQL